MIRHCRKNIVSSEQTVQCDDGARMFSHAAVKKKITHDFYSSLDFHSYHSTIFAWLFCKFHLVKLMRALLHGICLSSCYLTLFHYQNFHFLERISMELLWLTQLLLHLMLEHFHLLLIKFTRKMRVFNIENSIQN